MIRPLLLAAALAAGLPAHAAPTRYFRSPATAAANRPFSDAVQVGGILYLSGQIGAKPGEAAPVSGGTLAQARQAMDNIGATLAAHHLGYGDLFKCTVFLADIREWAAFNTVYATYFKPGHYPARSALAANGLALGAAVEIECWANAAR
jgi:2-iminobutanoate/2-iminopropanoate deaminase